MSARERHTWGQDAAERQEGSSRHSKRKGSVMAIRTCHRSMCHRRVEVNGKGDHKSLISPGKLLHERLRAESDHRIQ